MTKRYIAVLKNEDILREVEMPEALAKLPERDQTAVMIEIDQLLQDSGLLGEDVEVCITQDI